MTLGPNTTLSVKNNAQLEEQRLSKAAAEKVTEEPVVSDLLAYVKKCFEEASRKREESGVDEMLMEALRRRKGEYSASDLQKYRDQGSCTVFVPLTEQKCNGAEAWMGDVLMPYDEKIWLLDTTPLPDLPEELSATLAQQVLQNVMLEASATGVLPSPDQVEALAEEMRDDFEAMVQKQATDRVKRMEETIADQLKEGGWSREFKDFLSNVITFGTGVLKGPVVRSKEELAWDKSFEPTVTLAEKPMVEAPSPLDFYPSPDSTEVEDGYTIERCQIGRKELLLLSELPGYQAKQIKELLASVDVAEGEGLQPTDSERADLENKPDPTGSDPSGVEAFEFHGPVPGRLLKEWGVEKVKDHVDYDFQVIWSGRFVLKVVANPDPLGRKPYHKAVYKRTVGSFWGQGVPHLMRSSQDRANAAIRNLINNMGLSSGPQVVVDVDRLPPGEDVTHIYPWKVWQVINEQNLTTPAITFNQPDSNVAELQATYVQAIQDSELESGVPSYTFGGEGVSGVGRTVSGLSMLMNASSRGIKEAFANIDLRAVGPLIERFYVWNMLYNEDDSIKGDVKVVTRGATGMLLREIELQKISEFMDRTNNPVDQQYIGEGRVKLLRTMATLLNLEHKGVVPTDKELRKRVQEAQAQQAQAQALQQAQASAAGGGPNTLGTTPNQESMEAPPGL